MEFASAMYVWFLIGVFLGSWALIRYREGRLLYLLLASYFFYACWDWRLLGLCRVGTLSGSDHNLSQNTARPHVHTNWNV